MKPSLDFYILMQIASCSSTNGCG